MMLTKLNFKYLIDQYSNLLSIYTQTSLNKCYLSPVWLMIKFSYPNEPDGWLLAYTDLTIIYFPAWDLL